MTAPFPGGDKCNHNDTRAPAGGSSQPIGLHYQAAWTPLPCTKPPRLGVLIPFTRGGGCQWGSLHLSPCTPAQPVPRHTLPIPPHSSHQAPPLHSHCLPPPTPALLSLSHCTLLNELLTVSKVSASRAWTWWLGRGRGPSMEQQVQTGHQHGAR